MAQLKTQRYVALDVLRGMTVAGMILVNNPGTWSKIFPPLRHAAWAGCTPTDLVFPFFLFVVGAAMAFSFAKYNEGLTPDSVKKLIKRVVARCNRRLRLQLLASRTSLRENATPWRFLLAHLVGAGVPDGPQETNYTSSRRRSLAKHLSPETTPKQRGFLRLRAAREVGPYESKTNAPPGRFLLASPVLSYGRCALQS